MDISSYEPRFFISFLHERKQKIRPKIEFMVTEGRSVDFNGVEIVVHDFARTDLIWRFDSSLKLISGVEVQKISFMFLP